MASSRPIAAGEDYTPDDINNLRNDLLDPVGGHKHNGTDGAKVPFSHLDVAGASGSTAPAGGAKSYNDLANHVAASQGVHGLPAVGYVAGSNLAGVLIQSGSSTLVNGWKQITFPIAFNAPPVVVVTLTGPASWTGGGVHIGNPLCARDITASGFGAADNDGADGWGNSSFNWIAVGVKNP